MDTSQSVCLNSVDFELGSTEDMTTPFVPVLATTNPFVLLIIGVAFYFLYQRKLKPYFTPRWEEFKRRREEEAELAAIKKNPDIYREKMEAMERARQRMQEQYDQAAREMQEKEAAKEEAKRQEKIQEWENFKEGKGYRNKSDKFKTSNEATNESGKTPGTKKKATLRSGTFLKILTP